MQKILECIVGSSAIGGQVGLFLHESVVPFDNAFIDNATSRSFTLPDQDSYVVGAFCSGLCLCTATDLCYRMNNDDSAVFFYPVCRKNGDCTFLAQIRSDSEKAALVEIKSRAKSFGYISQFFNETDFYNLLTPHIYLPVTSVACGKCITDKCQ
uniref:AraC family transcriptional regulator n=1 Tax=Syphacia muris TaxID=451379 RepID=A0A0N5A9G2_9BILA